LKFNVFGKLDERALDGVWCWVELQLVRIKGKHISGGKKSENDGAKAPPQH
jgi:hypothetical protein